MSAPKIHPPEGHRSNTDRAPVTADAAHVLEVAAAKLKRGVRGAMAHVIARHGSAPSTPGQKLFVAEDGTCIGTVGGGAVEREVLLALDAMLDDVRAKPSITSFRLGAELGMCCGGRVEMFLEPLEASSLCLIIGGGHVGSACAPLLVRVGFAVTLVDERAQWAREGIEEGVKRVCGEFDDAGRELSPRAAVLVMTHDHQLDQRAIEWAIGRGFAFVGGIGSRAKAQRTRDRLEAKGVKVEDRDRIRMPLGVSIGARSPDEIAVSVVAEMIAWRRSHENR